MKRGVGVSAVKKKQTDAVKFSAIGKAMEETKMAGIVDVLDKFRSSLSEFAQKHKNRINSDPEFRLQFHSMCVSVGVDPLASNKGFWADILGVGDFYFELGIKIIQICLQTRSANGGIITLKELVARLREKQRLVDASRKKKSPSSSSSSSSALSPGQQQNVLISSEDVVRSIEKLEVLGKGFSLVQTGKNGEPLVLSVPLEVNRDHSDLMMVAQEIGYVSRPTMQSLYGWTSERFDRSIEPLLQEGIVWVDNQEGKLNIADTRESSTHEICVLLQASSLTTSRQYGGQIQRCKPYDLNVSMGIDTLLH
jgi:ESCRT-II complex subunit VPS22